MCSHTDEALKTLPGYLRHDSLKHFTKWRDHPFKFDPEFMYWSQIAVVFPRSQVHSMLLSKKLESIIYSLPYGPS